jgi:aspartate carbamoyltransferase catalytic subunit
MRMAIFATLLKVDELIEQDLRSVRWYVPTQTGTLDR